MAKAKVTRRFFATDMAKGASVLMEPSDSPQTFPVWAIEQAEEAGAATRVDDETTSAAEAAKAKGE